ncbi:MAG: hypothetical protein U1C51_00260, partial [Candidatus Izemoplasmatales bacterium]|nr:hypothetical protein [bacterium]MDZ4195660.1 hypothetical protein [Candidatus Izemoplasmatales bacterium]
MLKRLDVHENTTQTVILLPVSVFSFFQFLVVSSGIIYILFTKTEILLANWLTISLVISIFTFNLTVFVCHFLRKIIIDKLEHRVDVYTPFKKTIPLSQIASVKSEVHTNSEGPTTHILSILLVKGKIINLQAQSKKQALELADKLNELIQDNKK